MTAFYRRNACAAFFSPALVEQFTLPCGDEFYERLRFKAYVISDIHSPKVDPEQLRCFCDQCGREAQQKKRMGFYLPCLPRQILLPAL